MIPALYNLAASGLLPENFCVVGVARKGVSERRTAQQPDGRFAQLRHAPRGRRIAMRLLACVTAIEADVKDPASFDAMRDQLDRLEDLRGTEGNRLFYLATPPNAFLPIGRELGRTGMLKENGMWRRLVVEKPFGTDLASARR